MKSEQQIREQVESLIGIIGKGEKERINITKDLVSTFLKDGVIGNNLDPGLSSYRMKKDFEGIKHIQDEANAQLKMLLWVLDKENYWEVSNATN